MSNPWYPLLLVPIAVKREWGGSLLHESLRPDSSDPGACGESLELVDEGKYSNAIENGALAGETVRSLAEHDRVGLVGARHTASDPFPLRIRFLDVGTDLRLQVHPNTESSIKFGGGRPHPKAWYVIGARDEARVYVGIKPQFTQQHFISRVKSDQHDVMDLVNDFPSIPGDAYFITPGKVHAMSAGNLMYVVERGTGMTFSLNDAGATVEPDAIGIDRLDDATESVHYRDRMMARIRSESTATTHNRRLPLVSSCQDFDMDELRLASELRDRTDGSGFHVLTAIGAPVDISAGESSLRLDSGRTCLLPAELGYYAINPVEASARVLVVKPRP